MELTQPGGLWLLGALGPLVLLYILKTRRTAVVVSSVWLFREAHRELRARTPLRRLIPEIPLLLESLALIALALALSEITLGGRSPPGERVVLVVDTSASMSALGPRGTRLDEARDAAVRLIRGLGTGSEVLIVEAGKTSEIRGGFETDPRRVERTLRALIPRDEAGNLAPAIAIARERLLGAPRARLVVVTDLGADVPGAASVPTEVLRIGDATDNVGLVRAEIRRRPNTATEAQGTPERAEVLVLARNFGASRASRFVTLHRRGAPAELASRRVEIAPGETAAVSLTFEPGAAETGQGVVVTLSPGDALAVDDRAYAVIPPGARLPVILAPRGKHAWLARAFAADPGVELFETDVAGLASDSLPRDALWVVHGACPKDPPGSVVVVAPGAGDCLGVRVGAPLDAPRITSWARGDPRLRFVSFDDVHLGGARTLEAPRNTSLVRAGSSTLMAALELPGRAGTVLGFDPSESDWPLRASFVLFTRNLAEQARSARARAAGAAQPTGEALRLVVPGDPARATLFGPDGPLEARVVDGSLVVPAARARRAGFYDALDGAGKVVATVPAVLGGVAESDLLRRGTTSTQGATTEGGGAPVPARKLSPLLALLCLAAITAEGVYLTRRKPTRQRLALASRLVLGVSLLLAVVGAGYGVLALAGLTDETWVRLAHPIALVLGCTVLLGLGLRLLLRPVEAPPRRALVEAGLLGAALASALAASAPELGRPLPGMAVLVVTDRSRSTELVPRAGERIEAELVRSRGRMQPEDRLGVVAFADGATLEEPLLPKTAARSPQQALLGRDATDLAAGVARALSEVPSDSAARLIVVSDGVATRGDLSAATLTARLAGVPVDVLPLIQGAPPSVRVESLGAPSRVARGEALDLRVTTRATAATDVRIVVLRDGVTVRDGTHTLQPGEDVLYLRETAETSGLVRYDVRVVPVSPTADALPGDNEATAFVRVEGVSRALLLAGQPAGGTAIVRALESTAFQVDVLSPTQAPIGAGELAGYDLVVLSDVPAVDLPPERIDELAAHVEQIGGGLLLMGGPRSLGPGGYAGSRLETVSPVAFDVRNERRRARLAEVILIDYSGSMSAMAGGHTKLALANEAAARSAALLGPVDRLGVAHVDTAVMWTVPLAEHQDALEPGRKLRKVQPGGGGIYVDLALRAAYDALARENVELKHVLLFADGSDAEERQNAFSLVRDAERRGITTSVVSLGRGPDAPDLERMSRMGKGRFYLVEDAGRLPAVFAQETTLATRSAISETPFLARQAAPSPALRGVDVTALPQLLGHVVTRSKPRAEVHLLAPEGDPLLATWSAGIGRAAAFTSDLEARWGKHWVGSPEAIRLFAQLGRELGRRAEDPRVSVEAEISGGALVVRASALAEDGTSDVSRQLTAHVAGPSGLSETVPLEAVAPGAYAAQVPVTVTGAYVVTLTDSATKERVGTAGASFSASGELTPTGSDVALLERLAAATGGKVRSDLAGLFDDRPEPRRAFRPILGWLVVAAALSLLTSVSARRLSLPRVRWRRRRRGTKAATQAVAENRGGDVSHIATSNETDGGETENIAPGASTDAEGGEAAPAEPKEVAPRTTAETVLERRRRRR